MRLEQLLENVDYTLCQGTLSQNVMSVDYDSRKVKQDSLFVCISGANVDGHDFIEEVIAKGARVIVMTRDVPMHEGITYIKVKDESISLALVSCAFYNHPSKQLCVIGITGTKGKTTSSLMVKSILEKAGKKVGIIGTNGTFIGDVHEPTSNTTPESHELQRIMHKMVEAGCEYCVMEVSSQGLKLHRVEGIDFDFGIFTNLSPDHIGPNEHASFEEYKECKKHLFSLCKIGLFNKDDAYFEEMIKDVPCQVKTYSLKQTADLEAYHLDLYQRNGKMGISFATRGMVEGDFIVNMPGFFNAYNALVAIMIAHEIGVGKEDIINALARVQVLGRGQVMDVSEEYTVIIDYAHNGVSFESIISTVEQYHPERLLVVYGCGGKRSPTRRKECGETVAKHHGYSILTADNPRGEKVREICEDIAEAIKANGGAYEIIEDRKEAIYKTLDAARKGDVVLLLGKGHETYQIGEDEKKTHFSETEVIEDYKRERA